MTTKAPWPSTTGRSIFRGDPAFRGKTDTGESLSQISARSVRAQEKKGTSPSTIYGISQASDERAEEFARQKALRRGKTP